MAPCHGSGPFRGCIIHHPRYTQESQAVASSIYQQIARPPGMFDVSSKPVRIRSAKTSRHYSVQGAGPCRNRIPSNRMHPQRTHLSPGARALCCAVIKPFSTLPSRMLREQKSEGGCRAGPICHAIPHTHSHTPHPHPSPSVALASSSSTLPRPFISFSALFQAPSRADGRFKRFSHQPPAI
jgi:hypothetical protein